MKIHVFIIFVTLMLLNFTTGCREEQRHGNFTGLDTSGLVVDILAVLTRTHPPAQTHFRMTHSMDDAFGTRLVAALRETGYGVAEHADADPAKPVDGEIPFSYLLDKFDQTDSLHLTLYLGDQMLSRMYLLRDENGESILVPESYWTRKY